MIEDSGTVTVCLNTSRGIAAALMVDVVASIKPSSGNPACKCLYVCSEPQILVVAMPCSRTTVQICSDSIKVYFQAAKHYLVIIICQPMNSESQA